MLFNGLFKRGKNWIILAYKFFTFNFIKTRLGVSQELVKAGKYTINKENAIEVPLLTFISSTLPTGLLKFWRSLMS